MPPLGEGAFFQDIDTLHTTYSDSYLHRVGWHPVITLMSADEDIEMNGKNTTLHFNA